MLDIKRYEKLGNTQANNTWTPRTSIDPDTETVSHTNENYFWWTQQNQHEFVELLAVLNEHKVQNILEIGSSHGGNLFFLDKVVSPNGLTVGIEKEDEFAFSIQRYGDGAPEAEQHLLIKDSHDPETLEKVIEVLNGRQLDFLFIDGDHSYEGTLEDFDTYGPLVKEGGIIGLHDVAVEPRVQKLYDELPYPKQMLPVHHQGIGLIYLIWAD